uniref:Voltage dependent anion channel protein 2 n=1 Tax=Echinococcus granulosus TaxID=6210 RepID=A0A068X4L5_ECHGR|nr:voltage dependent anion channel protein 2 [Echinococcus granulosus]
MSYEKEVSIYGFGAMMPPSFTDIGKSRRDLLRKNFDLGIRFFSFKGKNDNLEFLGRVDNAFRVGKLLGTFESEYNLKEYGLTLKEKWSSKGLMSADVSVDGQIMDGLCNTLKTEYNMESGYNRVSLKSVYKKEYINGQVDFQFRSPLPDVVQSLVVGHQDYLVGADLHYDAFQKELRRVDFAFAYSVKDFGFHGIVTNWARTFTTGVYQRLTDRLEYAAEVTWNRDVPAHNWAIACQFATDSDQKHILKVKLDSLQRISVSLKNRIYDGITTAVCAMINDVEETQIGFGVEIER